MVCEGKLSKDIAKEMYMGKRTVDRMREKIIQKMGVKTPPEMAIYAVKYSIYIIPRDDFE
jgi:DNA-binding NarL/FixJ family response regulator